MEDTLKKKAVRKVVGAKPVGGGLLVEILTETEASDSQMYVSGRDGTQAYVIAIGPALSACGELDGAPAAKMGVKPGDRILLRGGCAPLAVPGLRSENGRTMSIIDPHDVRAVLIEGDEVVRDWQSN
jgi:hypothetical protein